MKKYVERICKIWCKKEPYRYRVNLRMHFSATRSSKNRFLNEGYDLILNQLEISNLNIPFL